MWRFLGRMCANRFKRKPPYYTSVEGPRLVAIVDLPSWMAEGEIFIDNQQTRINDITAAASRRDL